MTERADLAEVERNQRLIERTALPPTLGDFVRERAEALGDAIAGNWFEDDRTLSFRELDDRANRLASALVPLGVRKGTHVAVMLPNVPETFIVWTALARIGAVMVPVNVGYTAPELTFVLNDSGAQFVVIDAPHLTLLASVDPRPPMIAQGNVIVHGVTAGIECAPDMHRLDALIGGGESDFRAPATVATTDLLNIQYTSGTTGFPKGCLLSHEYWMRTGWSLAITRGESPGIGNVLVWAPFFYMDGQWQVLSAWFLGATAHVARRMRMSRFFDWLRDLEIHACTFPEPALKSFPPSPADAELSLRYCYAFGWRPEAKREAERRFGCHARDAYGMTEIGTALITPVAAGERNFERTCGLPAPDRRLKIVDEAGNEVAPGHSGELWVAGPGILWGYHDRPGANAEAFHGEWFRTGDIFRREDDGYYHIVGRIKDMVRRAGENIAAREVEAVLNEMDEIVESAVVPVPDERRGEEVKAYLRLRDDIAPDAVQPERIVAHCERHLAAFKVPRYISFVETFPRTPTRKIAKQRLIEGAADLRAAAWDRVAARWR